MILVLSLSKYAGMIDVNKTTNEEIINDLLTLSVQADLPIQLRQTGNKPLYNCGTFCFCQDLVF